MTVVTPTDLWAIEGHRMRHNQHRGRYCDYVAKRRAERRRLIAVLYANAANEHSRRMAVRLAKSWGVMTGAGGVASNAR